MTAPSDFLIDQIKGITRDGVFKTMANGLDLNRFRPMKKEKRILIVARLFENKGIQDILDALKGIDCKGWRVEIVGEGPYRKVLEQKAAENGLNDTVRFLGWMDNASAEMKELYGQCRHFYISELF